MDIETLQSIVCTLQCEQSVGCVLQNIVQGLAAESEIALARIWLLKPGGPCATCPMSEECPDQSACLHLVASDGHSIATEALRWDRIDGQHRRFPLNVRKVGLVGATKKQLLLTNVAEHSQWLHDSAWGHAESIQSFAGHPLIFRGEMLGVLAVFSRHVLDQESMIILRTFANQAAAAIFNARAFEEIGQLRQQLELENEYLREESGVAQGYGDIVGNSSALKKMLEQIGLVAPTNSTVLVVGESGTGKELVARAIHERGSQADKPLIRVNCASIPRELFESEFFGHVKGAFTGAIRDRVGRFELADGGTLFLDEVGEIPLDLQSKLLRVLQEGQFERVGDERTRHVNVRIIAATNRDLKAEVAARNFRQDLYYRLSVFPIELPPLRDRIEDLPELAAFFLEQNCKRLGLSAIKLKQRHVMQLQQYDWPGNIRELQNVIERAVITAPIHGLSFDLRQSERFSTQSFAVAALNIQNAAVDHVVSDDEKQEPAILTQEQMSQFERDNIIRALQASDWKVGGPNGAAVLLGIKMTTLASRIKSMQIEKP